MLVINAQCALNMYQHTTFSKLCTATLNIVSGIYGQQFKVSVHSCIWKMREIVNIFEFCQSHAALDLVLCVEDLTFLC
jgi:hypothetical protein